MEEDNKFVYSLIICTFAANLLIDKLAHRQIKNEYTKIYNCRKRR